MSNDVSLDINQESNPVQTVAPLKEDNNMLRATDKITALYCRLSVEDTKEKGGKDDPSNSIQHQQVMLMEYAKSQHFPNPTFFIDLSRLGRNYIEVGRLTEEFFPNHDIRLVAVSDNIDTDEGENELAPIRNLFNEWYARDISKKRRISNKIKGNAGEPMGQPPYGYIKDPENPKRWIVDEEAARVVRRIYRMTLEGVGTEQIAAKLEEDGVLTPRAYWHSKGINRPGKVKDLPPTHWNSSSVIKMLSVQE